MAEDTAKHSLALKSILGSEESVDRFFQELWQKACAFFPNSSIEPLKKECEWDENRVKQEPFEELIRCGWSSLIDLLENSRQRYDRAVPDSDSTPLLFRHKQNVDPSHYSHSLFHAYLDGCSVVINHADETCPYIASLCLDLQTSFPHAYANTYLTPPKSQAVRPHADDRDVLVIQIYGEKTWTIYKNIPVPYPFPPEQVGKDGLEVPPDVLNGPVLMQQTLTPGDVLYMPRGYVHEAKCLGDKPSYHVTIALATHDWTLSGMLTNATQHVLGSIIDYRMALPTKYGRTGPCNDDDLKALQNQIDDCFMELKRHITASSVNNNLKYKYQRHNNRALPLRQACIKQAKSSSSANANNEVVVGRRASTCLTLDSTIRAATNDERAMVVPQSSSQPRGLHSRNEIANAIETILFRLKAEDSGLSCKVRELRSLVPNEGDDEFVCDLTLLSFAKWCVELGALAIV